MRGNLITAEALVAAVVFGLLAYTVGAQHYGWAPTIANSIILVILFAFDRGPSRHFFESLAFAAVCAFLLITALILPAYLLVPQMVLSPASAITVQPWLPVLVLSATVIFLGIDRVRNNTRPVTLNVSTVLPSAAAPAEVIEKRPVALPEPPGLSTTEAPPVAQPVSGRPATIYINLVDAGIACLRPVSALHLGRDFYQISEVVPPGEAWEFATGQVVRCRKQKLSTGRALVAFEEAPRVAGAPRAQ